MIFSRHKKEVEEIGNDSWELLNFSSLPVNSSYQDQMEALRRDQEWQRNHMDVISRRIDEVIEDIRQTEERSRRRKEKNSGCSHSLFLW